MDVSQIAVIDLIIDKENRKYQLLLPWGAPWDEAEATIEEFKLALAEMKRLQKERLEESQKEQAPLDAEVVEQPAV